MSTQEILVEWVTRVIVIPMMEASFLGDDIEPLGGVWM